MTDKMYDVDITVRVYAESPEEARSIVSMGLFAIEDEYFDSVEVWSVEEAE